MIKVVPKCQLFQLNGYKFNFSSSSNFTHIFFLLFIPDAPVCITSSVTIVGASIDESVAIACRISADPSKVTFEWSFSNSGERYEVPSGHYTTIQSSNTDSDHIYLDTDESGTNGNGTLTFFFITFYTFFSIILILSMCLKKKKKKHISINLLQVSLIIAIHSFLLFLFVASSCRLATVYCCRCFI